MGNFYRLREKHCRGTRCPIYKEKRHKHTGIATRSFVLTYIFLRRLIFVRSQKQFGNTGIRTWVAHAKMYCATAGPQFFLFFSRKSEFRFSHFGYHIKKRPTPHTALPFLRLHRRSSPHGKSVSKGLYRSLLWWYNIQGGKQRSTDRRHHRGHSGRENDNAR